MIRSLLLVAAVLASSSAFAIRGDYLPESDLPGNVCRIVIGNMQQIVQPSLPNGIADRSKAPIIFESKDHFTCSANLIKDDTILTAGHCFQGTNEKSARKGRFPWPKVTADGKRAPGCEGEKYYEKKSCIDHLELVVVTQKWIGTRLECPDPVIPGAWITRPLDENMGYVNPYYTGRGVPKAMESISVANFDFAFYKFKQPIKEIKPMEVVWDYKELAKAVAANEFEEPNPIRDRDLCRSFGYGISEVVQADGSHEMEAKKLYDGSTVYRAKEVVGVLHGANTPPDTVTPAYISTLINYETNMPGIGYVDHGDSGGALMCRGRADRKYRLYGIVSRGLNKTDIDSILDEGGSIGGMSIDEMSELSGLVSHSFYSLPAYNASFYNYVLKNGAFPRSLDHAYWWGLMGPYKRIQLLAERDQTKQCISDSRSEMTRSTYRFYKESDRKLDKDLKSIDKEVRKNGNDQGLFMSLLTSTQFLENNRQLFWHCMKKVFFSDPS